ncbi:MAG TPA: ATP-binding cassette domain-containing protein [Acidimicrobiales bacterium]|nr:ATP-binding cassette domain-containing protein [Acidimicrobiales bacterium]
MSVPGAGVLTATATEAPRLSCREVSVQFGGIAALADVDLDVAPGSVVGLVGPNGAGKSTLFGVVSGLIRPSRGRVLLAGEDVTDRRPQHRADLGLARTFQHPELFVGLTVRDHLVLAHRAKHARDRVWSDLFTMGSLRPAEADEKSSVDELLDLLGLRSHAGRQAAGLPLGVARLLELGRALASSPSLLLLDEPSSGLDAADTAAFERILTRVARERGISVLLVEHDVDLVMRVCQRVYVLDFGQLIASGPPDAVRVDPAVRAAYLGEDLPDAATPGAGPPPGDGAGAVHVRETAADASGTGPTAPPVTASGAPLLRAEELRVRYGDAVGLDGVSFELEAGVALAVLGANGAGKSTLARALAGLVPIQGRLVLDGEEVTGRPAHRMRTAGLVLLPEGRGVFRHLTVSENLRMASAMVAGRRERREATARVLDIFPQLGRRLRQPAGRLSGGEQQMLSMARALVESPRVLVADELSLGLAPLMVDVVFEGLERAKREGVTVIMTEQYIHRALAFAEECLVLQRGQVAWHGASSVAEGEVLRHYLGDGMMAVS